jgi:hypothetical protein
MSRMRTRNPESADTMHASSCVVSEASSVKLEIDLVKIRHVVSVSTSDQAACV